VERLLAMGLEAQDYNPTWPHIIAVVRQRHGCPGPGRNGDCPFYMYSEVKIVPKFRVPQRRGDGKSGHYL
jgi:hypothetical protein